MNTDCTKPSVAPKPRFVCHARLKLPSPLMSSARGPKPSIAPKPKVTAELNGNQGGYINGNLLTSDSEADDEPEIQSNPNEVGAVDDFQADEQSDVYVLRSDVQHVEQKDQELTEEETTVEEEVVQKMEEDGRSGDGGLTEEVDSLLWMSDAGLEGGDSEETVEMVETEMTEDMDEDGCDAGEALADTDGLSVGDVSVNSTDGEAGCCSDENQHSSKKKKKKMTVKIQIEEDEDKDDCTADDLTESITEEPVFINSKDARAPLSDREEVEEEGDNSASDFGLRCKKFGYAHKMKDKTQHLQNVHFYDFVPEVHKLVYDPANRHIAAEEDRTHEPYYISSEDIINRELMQRNNTGGTPESRLAAEKTKSSGVSAGKRKETAENGQCSEDYVPIGNNGYSCHGSDKNKVRMFQKFPSVTTEETAEALLDHLDFQPRFRLVSISVPTDTDSSLTSSLSEIQLLSPNDSDLFRDDSDLDGDIVPFLEDGEEDVNDEPVYEEPRRSSESDNVFSGDRRSTETRSRSRLHRFKNNMADVGAQFAPRTYVSGIGQPAPGGSPMLTMINRTYVKPQYLSLYPRSISMEGQDVPLGAYSLMEGFPRQGGAISSSGSFSRVSPLSSSGLSTPTSVVDIPPPFELAYITKRPITKSSPTLFVEGDSSEKNKKKKSSIKRFLLLKFGKRKTDSKAAAEVSPSSSKPAAESGLQAPSRLLDLDQHSVSGSPQLNLRPVSKPHLSPEPAAKFLLYKDGKRKGSSVAFLNRSVVRVESFEDRSRVPFTSLPLTKPRSISFPNTDTSDYENVPAISSDYENLQIPQRRPVRQPPFPDFFDRPSRVLSSANETDGYVDMSSLPGFRSKTQTPEQETESAYTVCSAAASPQTLPAGDVRGATAGDEDQGRTSEEEDAGADSCYDRQPDGRSRAFYIAKELVDTERLHVRALQLLQEDFREAVGAAVGDEGEPVLNEERLREILNELPDVYTLHRRILNELENRIRHWEESQRIADIFLSRKSEFLVFTTYIGHYDRSMNLLEDSCRASPAFANLVQQFEQQHPAGENVSLKHQLLQVIVRVAQYRMLLTDYLNNLSPDSKEYEDTQAAVAVVSDIADQANDSLKHGENLLRLVTIDYSVRGQRDLLQPGRVFVKEGTLMKVSRRSRQPRHLFLMNDVLLYTYPQQDGKYRLKNTLPLSGLKVSKPIIENVQNPLRIEGTDISITLSASSFLEREDWFYTLTRTVNDQARCSVSFSSCSGEARDRLHTLGEKAPTLVPVSQVMMCMNCTSDFSLTLRRHHCHGCGRIVCRSCSRNRYPLKYMKDRMAKVCDHCYSELKKRGGDVSAASAKSSPRLHRSSRPLSSVFQNIHPPNIWRHRKGTASFTQVTVSEEGSISGSLQRSQKTKRSWKRLWFHLKDKEKVASESLPLLGFTVKLPDRLEEQEANIFQLYHKNTLYYTFKAVDGHTAQSKEFWERKGSPIIHPSIHHPIHFVRSGSAGPHVG